MNSRLFLLIFLFFTINVNAASTKFDPRGNSTENYSSRGLSLSVHSDKSRYSDNENITITCKLRNSGIYPITIYLHKKILKNFTIIVRDETGQSIPLNSDAYINDNNETSSAYYSEYTGTEHHSRSFILQPGESLERELSLSDIISFNHKKTKLNRNQIMAYFYPNAVQNPDLFLSSVNKYELFIDTNNLNRSNRYAGNSFHSPRLAVSPKELVYLALSAEYNRDWPNFFKYIDLHEIIRDYPEYAKDYMESRPQNRGMILEKFKTFLVSDQNHRLVHFKILEQKLKGPNASVVVRAKREIDGFERVFLYTYYLSPKDELWQITGLDSQLEK